MVGGYGPTHKANEIEVQLERPVERARERAASWGSLRVFTASVAMGYGFNDLFTD